MFMNQSVLAFLRRLEVHGVDKWILLLFYYFAEQLLNYCYCQGIMTQFGNLSVNLSLQTLNLIKRAGKIISILPPFSLQEIFERSVTKQGLKITKDINHIFQIYIRWCPQEKGTGYQIVSCKYKFTLMPFSVKILVISRWNYEILMLW